MIPDLLDEFSQFFRSKLPIDDWVLLNERNFLSGVMRQYDLLPTLLGALEGFENRWMRFVLETLQRDIVEVFSKYSDVVAHRGSLTQLVVAD